MISQKFVDGNITMQYSINPLNRYHKSISVILNIILKVCLLILVAIIYLALVFVIASQFKNVRIF